MMCLKCRQIKPLMQFGLRKMADGAIRNQPWCRGCRSGAGAPKPKPLPAPELSAEPLTELHAAEPVATFDGTPPPALDDAADATSDAPVAEVAAPAEPH